MEGIPGAYIWHTAPPLLSLARSEENARRAGVTMLELSRGHDLVLAGPAGPVDPADPRNCWSRWPLPLVGDRGPHLGRFRIFGRLVRSQQFEAR